MKKGISLIVLVITIIVMIILAASVVITLNNTGVINRADQAVKLTNQSQVQDLAALVWADAYMNDLRGNDLIEEVKKELEKQGVNEDDWNMIITDSGVTVVDKTGTTGLGSMITAADYGKTVDYYVTVGNHTYTDWKIYYHNSDYVYLVASDEIEEVSLSKGMTVASLTSSELNLYNKFRVGNFPKFELKDTYGGETANNSQAVVQLIKDYASFANTKTYGTDVVGAIGAPTIELLVAGWNAKGYSPSITLSLEEYGYKMNDAYYVSVTSDGLYVSADDWWWLASPSAGGYESVRMTGNDRITGDDYYNLGVGVRPVICLNASIPATEGDGTYDFHIGK